MISIIMPVYNTGKHLIESIGSILKQSYRHWELLLVDDGSDDFLTTKLLLKYVKEDNRIRMLHQEKSGAALARNRGLMNATGEYVAFFDADDCFNINMLEIMRNSIDNANADMCVSNYSCFTDRIEGSAKEIKIGQVEGITDRVFCVKELPENGLMLWNTAPWNKLYNRKFIIDNKVFFQNLTSSNDVFFSISCAVLAKKIVYCSSDKPLVNYRMGTGEQISSKRDPSNINAACKALWQESYISEDKVMMKRLMAYWLVSLATEIRLCGEEEKNNKAYRQIKEFLKAEQIEENMFCVEKHKKYLSYYLREADYHWMKVIGDYESQITIHHKELLDELAPFLDSEIIIWGYGKRGRACESILNSMNLKICIADCNNQNIGLLTNNGNRIISTNEAMRTEGVIIASNDNVFNSLKNCGRPLIRLEQYCLM